MPLVFQILIFLCVSLSVILGLFTVLKAEREDKAYEQIFLWLTSIVRVLYGIVFVRPSKQKGYFRRLRSDLFINNDSK